MIESSINTFEVQKHLFLNAARKTLFEIQKNGMRLDNDGIVALLGSAFSSGWHLPSKTPKTPLSGLYPGKSRLILQKVSQSMVKIHQRLTSRTFQGKERTLIFHHFNRYNNERTRIERTCGKIRT